MLAGWFRPRAERDARQGERLDVTGCRNAHRDQDQESPDERGLAA